jgi:hypothetical protein
MPSFQVYFPIVFSEFSPDTWGGQQQQQPSSSAAASSGPSASDDHFVFDQRRGYFRHFGYGIVSIYRQDFEAVGGFNLTIRGWGLEDVDLFERIVAAPALQLFRAPDPGLYMISYIIVKCQLSSALPQVWSTSSTQSTAPSAKKGATTSSRAKANGKRAKALGPRAWHPWTSWPSSWGHSFEQKNLYLTYSSCERTLITD